MEYGRGNLELFGFCQATLGLAPHTMRVGGRSTAGCSAARLRHTGAELAYDDTGIRTSVRSWSGNALTFLEFRLASPSSSASTAQLECELAPAEHGIL